MEEHRSWQLVAALLLMEYSSHWPHWHFITQYWNLESQVACFPLPFSFSSNFNVYCIVTLCIVGTASWKILCVYPFINSKSWYFLSPLLVKQLGGKGMILNPKVANGGKSQLDSPFFLLPACPLKKSLYLPVKYTEVWWGAPMPRLIGAGHVYGPVPHSWMKLKDLLGSCNFSLCAV